MQYSRLLIIHLSIHVYYSYNLQCILYIHNIVLKNIGTIIIICMYLPTKIIIIIIVHTEQLLSSATFKFQLVSNTYIFFPDNNL